MSNWQEWMAGTDPTNGLSVLRLVTATNSAAGLSVVWQSVSTRGYFVQRCTNLLACPAFVTVATNLAGANSTTKYTDTTATGPGPFLYRVGIQQ